MASRATEAGAEVLIWDAENRLVGYQSSVSSASYAYDGNGVRVRTVITDSGGVTTTVHIGGAYEWVDGSAARSYYYQGSQRVAMREGGELYFLLGDHLGSTSGSYRVSDGQTVTQTYHAWGDIRSGPDNALPTDYAFTGQRMQGETGLYQMGARWYDALTGRWLSADTIVPGAGNPQSLNRYTYVNNNPMSYTDPDGHTIRSALNLVRKYRDRIKEIATQYDLDPLLLAGVVFAENRNDFNWIPGQDWTSIFSLGIAGGPEIKNLLAPIVKENPSLGITEVSVAVAAMMDDPGLVPANYGSMSYEERVTLHAQVAKGLSGEDRKRIIRNLKDPEQLEILSNVVDEAISGGDPFA